MVMLKVNFIEGEIKMIIKELDEQQCINRYGYENIMLDKLIKDNILYMYDLIGKCDECGLCWMNEEEID